MDDDVNRMRSTTRTIDSSRILTFIIIHTKAFSFSFLQTKPNDDLAISWAISSNHINMIYVDESEPEGGESHVHTYKIAIFR